MDSFRHINYMGVVPLGVVEQSSINEKGSMYTKRLINHDFSFSGPSKISVNNIIMRDTLQLYVYGFLILHILHMMAFMCLK